MKKLTFLLFFLLPIFCFAIEQTDSLAQKQPTETSLSSLEGQLKDLEAKIITVLEKEEEIIEETGILGISLDVFATIVITILVFGLGQGFMLWQSRGGRQEDTDDFKNMVFAWVEESKPDIENRIESLRAFSVNLHDAKSTGTIVYDNYMIPIDRLGVISLERYMLAFLSNSKAVDKTNDLRNKHTHNLIYSTDYLIKMDEKISKAEEQYYQDSHAINKRFDTAMQEMYLNIIAMSGTDTTTSNTEPQPEEMQVSKRMMQLYVDFDAKVKEDPSNINCQLFESLIPAMKKLIPLCKDNYTLAFRIMKIVDDFEKLENDWNILKTNYSKKFIAFAKDSQKSLSTLTTSCDYLKEGAKTCVSIW